LRIRSNANEALNIFATLNLDSKAINFEAHLINLVTLKDLSKLIELKRTLSLKLKNNLREIMLLKLKKCKIVNEINKFNLLLKFLIRFENKTTSCCRRNIFTKSSFNLVFTKFKNLLITFVTLDCVNKVINKQISLF